MVCCFEVTLPGKSGYVLFRKSMTHQIVSCFLYRNGAKDINWLYQLDLEHTVLLQHAKSIGMDDMDTFQRRFQVLYLCFSALVQMLVEILTAGAF